MGSSHKHIKLQSHIKMNIKIVLLFAFVCAASGRVFILDDAEFDTAPVYRVRRDAPPSYGPPAPAYNPAPAYHGPPGRVGPVYTLVKTDPQANFKWGVRHRAGARYGRQITNPQVQYFHKF